MRDLLLPKKKEKKKKKDRWEARLVISDNIFQLAKKMCY